jgi:hypothetical protein
MSVLGGLWDAVTADVRRKICAVIRIWGSESGGYEEFCLLDYDVV